MSGALYELNTAKIGWSAMNRRESLRLLSITLTGLGGFALAQLADPLRGLSATVYKSPTCGCCAVYCGVP